MARKQLKHLLSSLLLILIFSIALIPGAALAAGAPAYFSQAQTLNALGLFMGTENGFELERNATRAESAVMLTRLLGQEKLAQEENFTHPFTDAYPWASSYIGYLYQQKLTNGVAAHLYGPGENATPQQFVTFVLRSLGYEDKSKDGSGDFAYEDALTKGLEVGLFHQEEMTALQNQKEICRDDCVMISYHALFAHLKGQDITLLEKLYLTDGVVSENQIAYAKENDPALAAFAAKKLGIGEAPQSLTAEEILAKTSPAVFLVEIYDKKDVLLGTGSGFFLSADGKFVTNYHVIENAYQAKVHLASGEIYPVDAVLGVDKTHDLAILQIKAERAFPYLEVINADFIADGDKIYALGSPNGKLNVLSTGVISHKQQKVNDQTLIQMTAPIAAGSSGGALLNEQGQVVGVTSSGVKNEKNVGFAVPANRINQVLLTEEKSLALLFEETHLQISIEDEDGSYWEQEPNDTRGNANIVPGDEMVNGHIDTPNDVDMYQVSVTKRTHIAVGLTCGADWFTENLTVMLIDDNEKVLAISDGEIINDSCMQTLYTTVEPGDYYLALLQNGPKEKDHLWYDVPYYMIYFCQ